MVKRYQTGAYCVIGYELTDDHNTLVHSPIDIEVEKKLMEHNKTSTLQLNYCYNDQN